MEGTADGRGYDRGYGRGYGTGHDGPPLEMSIMGLLGASLTPAPCLPCSRSGPAPLLEAAVWAPILDEAHYPCPACAIQYLSCSICRLFCVPRPSSLQVSGKTYYHNQATGESTWDPPPGKVTPEVGTPCALLLMIPHPTSCPPHHPQPALRPLISFARRITQPRMLNPLSRGTIPLTQPRPTLIQV